MRQPMKIRFAIRSIRPLWRHWVEGPEEGEEGSAERRRPRSGVDSVGDGVANQVRAANRSLMSGSVWDGPIAAPDSLRALR